MTSSGIHSRERISAAALSITLTRDTTKLPPPNKSQHHAATRLHSPFDKADKGSINASRIRKPAPKSGMSLSSFLSLKRAPEKDRHVAIGKTRLNGGVKTVFIAASSFAKPSSFAWSFEPAEFEEHIEAELCDLEEVDAVAASLAVPEPNGHIGPSDALRLLENVGDRDVMDIE